MSFPPPSDKQARILWMSLTGLAIGILLALIGLLAWGLGWVVHLLSPILWPLAIAGTIAYLLDPMVEFFGRHRVPRARAILLVFIICMGAVFAVLAQVVPRLVFETQRLIEDFPKYSRQVQEDVSGWISETPMLLEWKERFFPSTTDGDTNALPDGAEVLVVTNAGAGVITNLPISEVGEVGEVGTNETPGAAQVAPDRSWANKAIQSGLTWLKDAVPVMGNWLLERMKKVASWAGMIVGLALVPVFTFYFLLEKKSIEKTWTDYLPVQESKIKEELVFVLKAINEYMIVFFRGQMVVAMCIGVLLTIGFLAMGLNFAVLLGVLAGVLSIIPFLGAILTIVPAIILAAVQFKDWWHPLIVVGIFAAVQSLEGLVISPKIMGDRVGLHPMTIIVAVLVGTTLMGGILGGILAIPLTAALRVLMFRYVWKERPAK